MIVTQLARQLQPVFCIAFHVCLGEEAALGCSLKLWIGTVQLIAIHVTQRLIGHLMPAVMGQPQPSLVRHHRLQVHADGAGKILGLLTIYNQTTLDQFVQDLFGCGKQFLRDVVGLNGIHVGAEAHANGGLATIGISGLPHRLQRTTQTCDTLGAGSIDAMATTIGDQRERLPAGGGFHFGNRAFGRDEATLLVHRLLGRGFRLDLFAYGRFRRLAFGAHRGRLVAHAAPPCFWSREAMQD